MNQRIEAVGNAIAGTTGGVLVTAPRVIDLPFYETELWGGFISILGAVVLVLTAMNLIRTWFRDRKK